MTGLGGKRWIGILVAPVLISMIAGYGTESALAEVGPAVGFWFWGFDRGRAGKPQLFDRLASHETQRLVLFVAAVLAAAMMLAGLHSGHEAIARRGEEFLYLAIGVTIRRQGYRVGSKQLEWWEYRDELKYGSLGDLVVMLVVASVVIATGHTVGIIQLAMVVAPMGMIAVADEPSYGDEGAHAMRFLIRMHRRVKLGVPDEAW